MKETYRECQIKVGKKWVNAQTQSGSEALHSLASDLSAKYIGKASYIKRIERKQNYNGTQTYTVYYDFDDDKGHRSVYTTDIY